MRLLLINPNTSMAVTNHVVAAARRLSPDIEIEGATGRFGARYIASRGAYAIAGHAALDALATHARGFDAVVLACFGDPGLDALKEMSRVPVIGMAEAALHVAMQVARRFSIVTGGSAWQPMLQDYAAARGLARQLASVRTVNPTGASLMVDEVAGTTLLREACEGCIAQDGAEAIVVGGAGLVAYAPRLRVALGVPVVDGLEAALAAARTAVQLGASAAPAWCTQVETVGLSRELADWLRPAPG